MTSHVFKSLSGHCMAVADDDAVLLIISDVKWRRCEDMNGRPVIGPENAFVIRDALRQAGFEIAKKTPEA